MILALARKTGFWLRQLVLEACLSIRLVFEPFLRWPRPARPVKLRVDSAQFPPLDMLSHQIDPYVLVANDVLAPRRNDGQPIEGSGGAGPLMPLP